MDRLDWEYDKGTVILVGLLWIVALSVLTVAAGFLFHIGWTMYQP